MVLGSDVPLRKDILRKPTEFVKNWLEWSADNRQIVAVDTFTLSATQSIMFTVPENNTFFLTSVWANVVATGGVAGLRNAIVGATVGTVQASPRILKVTINDLTSANSNSIAYPMPMKIQAGGVVTLNGTANARSDAGITGFLVPKRIT